MSKRDITIDDLINKLSKIQIELEQTKIELRQLKEERQDKKTTKVEKKTNPTDRFGTPLKKGCRIKFLTKGRFPSTDRVVIGIGSTRVTATDDQGNDINRAFHNVEVVE